MKLLNIISDFGLINVREECGVSGIILNNQGPQTNITAFKLYYSLYALQHRGQDSTGIVVFDGLKSRHVKSMGLVSEAYNKQNIKDLTGYVGIGHVRSATEGTAIIENCQPFTINFRGSPIAISHNGSLVNAKELREEIESEGRILMTDLDAEIIALILVKELLKRNPIEAIQAVMKKLVGSYGLTIILNGDLYAVRDPLGIKPLCYGTIDGGFAVVSESVGLDTINGKFVRDILPGEIVALTKDGKVRSVETEKDPKTAHCIFEYIYLARPDSVIDGKLVYEVREKIGKQLAKEHGVPDGDIVCPVPDSGIASAIGYARESKIMYLEGLMKNRYIGRTFILPTQESRDMAIRLKMNTIDTNLKDKKVVLVDDSIVRGTTSRRIIDMMRKSGTDEIHLRVASPPIMGPCYFGTSMASRNELIASKKTNEGICTLIGADTLEYISIEGLVSAIGIPEEKLCLGCVTQKYPLKIEGEKTRELKDE